MSSNVPHRMEAIGCKKRGGVEVLETLELEVPQAEGTKVLVQVKATSVNPVDTKIRNGGYRDVPDFYNHVPGPLSSKPHILGFDCSGVIVDIGVTAAERNRLKKGDEVYFLADMLHGGANAEYTLVEEEIVAKKPENLDWKDSAALPLVSMTAWEALVERLGIKQDEKAGLLIINGSGGVGSMAIQVASKHLHLPLIIATASRPETQEWCKSLGSTHVVNHREDVKTQVNTILNKSLDHDPVPLRYIFICASTEQYLDTASELAAPFGKICGIQETDVNFKDWAIAKSLTYVWEYLGTKMFYKTDMATQANMLTQLAGYFDRGEMKTPASETSRLTLKGLKEVHSKVEEGKVKGKIVLVVDDEDKEGEGRCFE